MAHRLVWKSQFDDRVAIYERGERVTGTWRSDTIANPLTVRSAAGLRVYVIREWISTLECRATLQSIQEVQ